MASVIVSATLKYALHPPNPLKGGFSSPVRGVVNGRNGDHSHKKNDTEEIHGNRTTVIMEWYPSFISHLIKEIL